MSSRRPPPASRSGIGPSTAGSARPAEEPGAAPSEVPACHPFGGCITCSDEGVPMRVLDVTPALSLATCADESGARSEVMTDLVGPVSPGDRLLVHAGTALLALDPAAEAEEGP